MQQPEQSKICVVVRKRPLSKKEIQKGDQDIIDVRDTRTLVVREIKLKVDLTKYIEEHSFNFDMGFDQSCTNEQLYMSAVRPIIEAAFQKARVTCFAYGQTGSGKTYTMLGDQEKGIPGLYLLACYDIFSFLEQDEFSHLGIYVAFFEIYCGKLFDLLNDRNQLTALEDAKGHLNIVGLSEKKVLNVQNLMQIIEHGQSIRVTSKKTFILIQIKQGQNSTNVESSRSHALVQILLKNGKQVHGKLSFIDLAGSERGADVSNQNKQTRIDGAEINKSLLALKECIRALDQNKNHTPFRGSKLTLVLKDSFTGNCKTVMIGNISPSSSSSEHTLNTLRYADRVKELKKSGGSNDDANQQFSNLDQLARELMLPRQESSIRNVVKLPFKEADDSDDEEQYQPPKLQNRPFSNNQKNNFVNELFKNNSSNANYPNKETNHLFQQEEPIKRNQRVNGSLPKQSNQKSYHQNQPGEYQQVPVKQQLPQHPLVFKSGSGQTNLQQLSFQHEELVQIILEEEEAVLNTHREHIDHMVDITKQEMVLLNQVELPGSDINNYVRKLQAVIEQKIRKIQYIKEKVDQFADHLQQEDVMSKQFYAERQSMLAKFELKGQVTAQQVEDDLELLENLEDYNEDMS